MFEEWLLNGKQGDALELFEIFKEAPEHEAPEGTEGKNEI